MTRNFGWNSLIVALTIALVLVPFFLGPFDREIANWHLAAAANALQLGEEGFEENVDKARQAVDDLSDLHDYWLIRVMESLVEEPGEVPQIVQEAKEAKADYVAVGRYAFSRLRSNKHYAAAVEVLELILNEATRAEPEILNELAYFRSLAAVDLDRALEDITEALEFDPDNEAFRDTRAWVLFQMGKPLEALEDAEFAVSRLEKIKQQLADDPLARITGYLERISTPVADKRQGETLNELEAGPILWNEGVLRYHRARILEALGRDDEAQTDLSWINERNLPLDGRLQ